MSLQPRQQKHRVLTPDNPETETEAVFGSSVFYLLLLIFAIKPDTKLNMLAQKKEIFPLSGYSAQE